MLQRRRLVGAALLAPVPAGLVWAQAADATDQALELLRQGGCVVAFRHALAPGTFDPPGFRLDECKTQRNLNHEGRDQARRIGQWFSRQGLVPATVRSSPWCRCMDTATLAFGDTARAWPALGSPAGRDETIVGQNLALLRQALQAATQRPGRFEAWVTHMFVLAGLAQTSTLPGQALVLRADATGQPQVLARLSLV